MTGRIFSIGMSLLVAAAAAGQEGVDLGIEAHISAPVTTVPPGEPVIVQFTLRNLTDQPVVLTVPGMDADTAQPMAGLDLAHVFSGPAFEALSIEGSFNRVWRDSQGYHPAQSAPKLVIAPHGIVGTTLAIDAFYPQIKSAGLYRIMWEPFGGLVRSNVLSLDIASYKKAVILTDEGSMTMMFDYGRAPSHVANFIELARSGFYNQKSFHRIEPGYYMQGGDPNGDGTGIRLDGKKLDAEFNDRPVNRGTVCMARLESDPNSASCQFIITNTRLPSWDGRYTAFGQLVGDESYDTLEKLMSTPVNEYGRPLHTVKIRVVRVEETPLESYEQFMRGDVSIIQSYDSPIDSADSMRSIPDASPSQPRNRGPIRSNPPARDYSSPTRSSAPAMEPMLPMTPIPSPSSPSSTPAPRQRRDTQSAVQEMKPASG